MRKQQEPFEELFVLIAKRFHPTRAFPDRRKRLIEIYGPFLPLAEKIR
jgi:hypothetical protein